MLHLLCISGSRKLYHGYNILRPLIAIFQFTALHLCRRLGDGVRDLDFAPWHTNFEIALSAIPHGVRLERRSLQTGEVGFRRVCLR